MTASNADGQSPVRLAKYILVALGVTFGVAILLGIVFTALGIDPTGGTGIISFIAAVGVAGSMFAKDHKRAPTKGERAKFSFILVLIQIIIGIALVLLIVSTNNTFADAADLNAFLYVALPIIALVIGGLYWVVGYFAFGWIASSQVKAMDRKDAH